MKTENKNIGVHLRHCYQGEYSTSCKYGDENCPAKIKKINATKRMDGLVPQDALRRLQDASGEIKHALIADGFTDEDVNLYLKELVE